MILFYLGVAAGFVLGVLALGVALFVMMLYDDRERRR